jgi:hypothetical protein
MIAGATDWRISRSRVQPPANREGTKHMFVGAPRQDFRNVFGLSVRVRRNAVSYRHICLGRLHSDKCHTGSLSVRLVAAHL